MDNQDHDTGTETSFGTGYCFDILGSCGVSEASEGIGLQDLRGVPDSRSGA